MKKASHGFHRSPKKTILIHVDILWLLIKLKFIASYLLPGILMFQGFIFQIVANLIVFLCANVLGVSAAIMEEGTQRSAFLETKASLSVSSVLEESLKEQVNHYIDL